MIELPVSQARLTSGGSNERFSGKSGKTGRCDAARKKHQREFKEKLLQVGVSAVFQPFAPPVRAQGEVHDEPCQRREAASVVGIGDEISGLAQYGMFRWSADHQPIGARGKSGVCGAFTEICGIDKLESVTLTGGGSQWPAEWHRQEVLRAAPFAQLVDYAKTCSRC